MFDYDLVKDFTVKECEFVNLSHVAIKFNESSDVLHLMTRGDCCDILYFYKHQGLVSAVGSHITGIQNVEGYEAGEFTENLFPIEYNNGDHEHYDVRKCKLVTSNGDIPFELLHFSNGYYEGELELHLVKG